ncbi:MAG: LytTR family transcriptional regulator DNA-binding domain-containing protein [Lachnospiraceae bacterium]|nr:LytTR family transcriptional regulator DNA-binding domain-containing protein [Lachnospiraceae bacterium]
MDDQLANIMNQGKLIHFEGTQKDVTRILECLEQDAAIVDNQGDMYERMTVKKYLEFFAKLLDHRSFMDSAIDQMHLTDFLDKKIGKCTKGQRKRVEIAREILKNEKEYFLLNPLGDIDADSRKIILGWMDSFHEKDARLITLSQSHQYTCLCPGEHYEMTDQGIECIDKERTTEWNPDIPFINKISATYNEKIFLFNPEDIDYAEASEGKVYIYVHNEKYSCSFKMDDLEKKLSRFGFYRCHRSYLVNMQKVVEIIKWTRNSYSMKLVKYENTDIPLSKAKIQELRNMYQW